MDIKDRIANDKRFYINSESMNFIARRPISEYNLDDICVGQIRRRKNGKIISLYKTEPYQYLNNRKKREAQRKYIEYCKNNNMDNSHRSMETFY